MLLEGSGQMPALLIRMSRRPKDWEMKVNTEEMDESDVTSSWIREVVPGLFKDLIFERAALPLSKLREPMITW